MGTGRWVHLVEGLAAHHEPHGGEGAAVAAVRAAPAALLQHDLHLVGPRGHQADQLQHPQRRAGQAHAHGVHLELELQGVPGGVQRHPPRLAAEGVVQRHVSRLNQLCRQVTK
jgi:hypothetical protein